MAISKLNLRVFGPTEAKVLVAAFYEACDRLGCDSKEANDVAHAMVCHALVKGVDRDRLIEVGVEARHRHRAPIG